MSLRLKIRRGPGLILACLICGWNSRTIQSNCSIFKLARRRDCKLALEVLLLLLRYQILIGGLVYASRMGLRGSVACTSWSFRSFIRPQLCWLGRFGISEIYGNIGDKLNTVQIVVIRS